MHAYGNLKFLNKTVQVFKKILKCVTLYMVNFMNELQNKKILIADDEREILQLLQSALEQAGFYWIFTAASCREALRIFQEQNIALCVLDINLPDGDGFSLLREIRNASQVPVIFLTARGEANDKLQGLELGADDYMVKPFLTKEFLLRVTAVLRRTYGAAAKVPNLRLSDRTINFETAEVKTDNGEIFPLTAKEFILLQKLHENKGRIVTNDALCLAAWGDEYYGYENTMMVHIRRLRKKIETNPSSPKHLITVRGLGYKLVTGNE